MSETHSKVVFNQNEGLEKTDGKLGTNSFVRSHLYTGDAIWPCCSQIKGVIQLIVPILH